MTESVTAMHVQKVKIRDLYQELLQLPIFANSTPEELEGLGEAELVEAPAGTELIRANDETNRAFWIILSGEVRGEKVLSDGSVMSMGVYGQGTTFGEVPLLAGRSPHLNCTLNEDSRILRMDEDSFWKLMFHSPKMRISVLGTMAERLQAYQSQAVHREKLISLGTLVAGLMHELNNPGAAATRAASQLRENLTRLQNLSLKFCATPLTNEQIDCLRELQEEALTSVAPQAVSSLEEADAEEALTDWLDNTGVENGWKIAPALCASNLDSQSLECARSEFDPARLSDALNWLAALVSSVQLVGTIEESINRVSSLVIAVKKFARPEDATIHEVDVHDNIQSTLTILAHKFRHKELKVEKEFSAQIPRLTTRGAGLSQVWTNLLDNAIDASPQKGLVRIRTWNDDSSLFVSVSDHGSGIADVIAGKVFEPFFTTKPVGEGTGLGLDLSRKIVIEQYRGEISFTSSPQGTDFLVRLPLTP
jgi:signal transduction histidine kinase